MNDHVNHDVVAAIGSDCSDNSDCGNSNNILINKNNDDQINNPLNNKNKEIENEIQNIIKSQESDSSHNIKIYFDKILGKGSYAKVFPGRYKNKMVAVKIIKTNHLSPKVTKQLEREFEIIRLLQKNYHPNIAAYYKIYHAADKMVIVMELCSGGELKKHIEKGLDYVTVRNYFSQILKGYKHLLSLNIIHRDIKSANILLANDKNTIKFIDFGLSKIFEVDLNRTILGTPLYMAPELLNNTSYDSKSDIWSLGVLLYEMVYGVTPFHHHKKIETLEVAVRANDIKYPQFSAKNLYVVPDNLIQYMKKLLELDPHNRMNWDDICNAEWLDESLLHIGNIRSSNIHMNPSSNVNTNTNVVRTISKESINRKNPKKLQQNTYANANTFNNSPYTDRYLTLDDILISSEDNNNRNTNQINNKNNNNNNINNNQTRNDKRSEPIPIGGKNNKYRAESQSYGGYGMGRGKRHDNGIIYPLSYGQSPRSPLSETASQQLHTIYGESVGDVYSISENDIDINDLSVIDNNPGDNYDNLLNKQKTKASGSGLIDLNDVDGLLIASMPERTTAYEYFSRGSAALGSYLYSYSAPVATTVATTIAQGLGSVGLSSVK